MSEQINYSINLQPKFGSLELIDVPALAASVTEQWFNQTLCGVNDCVVRLGVMQGEFHWHKHDTEDEFFFVLDGEFLIDLEGQTVSLKPHQGFTVPKGVLHRTRAPQRTTILMVEQKSIQPTGN
ncbi:MAG: cupin domain-containing protein [Anaerolineaceae bacterium]|nr:cupin domain-containing protein [Anaerolineaceae bacterium]